MAQIPLQTQVIYVQQNINTWIWELEGSTLVTSVSSISHHHNLFPKDHCQYYHPNSLVLYVNASKRLYTQSQYLFHVSQSKLHVQHHLDFTTLPTDHDFPLITSTVWTIKYKQSSGTHTLQNVTYFFYLGQQ